MVESLLHSTGKFRPATRSISITSRNCSSDVSTETIRLSSGLILSERTAIIRGAITPGTPSVVAIPTTPGNCAKRCFNTGALSRCSRPVTGTTITCSLLKPSLMS